MVSEPEEKSTVGESGGVFQQLSHLLILVNVGLLVQHGIEQRTMDLYFAVVIDEPLFAEFVHEKAYPGSGGADHFGQRFLTEGNRDGFAAAFLAEIGEQQQQARKPSFAGI